MRVAAISHVIPLTPRPLTHTHFTALEAIKIRWLLLCLAQP